MKFEYQISLDDSVVITEINMIIENEGYKGLISKSKRDERIISKEQKDMIASGWHILKFGLLTAYWRGDNAGHTFFSINRNIFKTDLA